MARLVSILLLILTTAAGAQLSTRVCFTFPFLGEGTEVSEDLVRRTYAQLLHEVGRRLTPEQALIDLDHKRALGTFALKTVMNRKLQLSADGKTATVQRSNDTILRVPLALVRDSKD